MAAVLESPGQRRWLCWLIQTVASSAADDLRTVAGTGQLSRGGQIHQDMRQGVPHLAVRVRDGTGLVGPLVIPGMTSCLGNC
jgi:hypothetical protein